jgi:superfamily II DNA or RNA helicase
MKYEYRQYQEDAVAACLKCYAQGRNSVMLESPVGSGKTLMALKILHCMQERMGRRLRINWIAPRHHLLQQVMEANLGLFKDDIRPVSLFEKVPPPAEFVVLDEAHHEATQSCVLLYEKMHNTWTLGLSATPLRTDRMKLSFQETVTTCGIGRLIREGFLSPFHSYLLPHYDVKIVAECYMQSPEKWGKSLVFFHTICECMEFQAILDANGIPCEVVTSDSDKDAQLERFCHNRTRVIVNVSMLTEGFDQPDVQSIFARDASRLPTIQMCGRGLRRCDGKEKCNIIQSCNTSYLFEKVAPAQNAFRLMNGQWLALKDGTEEINATIAQSLKLLEQRDAIIKNKRNVSLHLPNDYDNSGFRRETNIRGNKSISVSQSLYYQTFGEIYKEFYGLYDFCNSVCWNNHLPKCVIFMNRRDVPSHVMAFAKASKAEKNGVKYPGICFNLRNCSQITPEHLMCIMLHEMTHIWQFANGLHGGHGRDFYGTMVRIGVRHIGVRRKEEYCRNGSLADYILKEAQQNHPDICLHLREMLESDIPYPPEGDVRFFWEAIVRE